MLKKMMISGLMKIKVCKKDKGEITFKINGLKKIRDEYKQYESFLHIAIKKLKGIKGIDIDFNDNTMCIKYDDSIVSEGKVLMWVDAVKEIGIKNYEIIEKYGENNLDYVVKTVEAELDRKVKLLNS